MSTNHPYQQIIKVESVKETFNFAAKFAQKAQKGDIVFLKGELGAGKTTLVRGFLKNLGYQDTVKSPTYTLVESYHLKNGWTIHHFDLYRLKSPEELHFLGLDHYFTHHAICLIEWPENGINLLPSPTFECTLRLIDENSREIILKKCLKNGKISL